MKAAEFRAFPMVGAEQEKIELASVWENAPILGV